MQSILILPTWLVFRFAPGYPRHTLPEGFFLQVFLSVQALLLSFFGYWSGYAEIVLCEVFMYITYWQLFGYGWWGTLWRFAVIVLTQVAVIVIAIALVIYLFVLDMNEKDDIELIEAFIFIQATTAVLAAVILFVTHRINLRNCRPSDSQNRQ